MNDASERLAPVTYLPWAAPPDHGRASGPTAADRHDDAEERAASTADAGDVGHDSHGGFGDRSADRDNADRGSADLGSADRRSAVGRGAGWSRRRGRLAAVAEGEVDETGPERDERIDRLVVSRLRRSALSVAEVCSVLVEHGLDESEVEEWIERYQRLGYLDDARLAEQLVHVNGTRRGRGSGAILQELVRRGVDDSAARAAVGELDPEVERANALAVAERRARQLAGLDRQTAERRLSAFLQRRGYPGGVVREAVKAALSADGS